MRTGLIITLTLILQFLNTQAQQGIAYYKNPSPNLAYSQISMQDLRADIANWRKVMEESHVDMHHHISQQQMDELVASLLVNHQDSISHTQAVLIISRLAGALNEGHLGLVSSDIADSLYQETKRFPFVLKGVSHEGWEVNYDLSTEKQLKTGDRITAINDIPISTLNQQYEQYFGGLPVWKKEQVSSYSRKLLFLHGITSPFRIRAIRESDGQTISYTTHGFGKDQLDSINKVLASMAGNEQRAPYSFNFLNENKIGYLNYRQMSNSKEYPFERFLDSTFQQLQEKGAEGLIIDIRENGGGNSQYGEWLLNYFNTKPFQLANGIKWKISEHYKAFLKTMRNYNEEDHRFYLDQANGSTYVYVNKELTQPKPRSPFFTGKVAVLIGPRTFSSANMLADGITTFQLARTFGEETGEIPNDYGEMFHFMLPNTHIIARAPSKMFTRANANEKDFSAVRPDVVVRQQKGNNTDKVLETAVNWMLEQ